MRTHKLLLFRAMVITMFLSSVSYGAIYYINDGVAVSGVGDSNAPGSTFTTSGSLSWSTATGASYPAYGTDYTYSNGGSATGTFTFQGIPTADYYAYAGWSPPTSTASRTADGTITVTGTSSSIVANPVNHKKHADGSNGVNYTGSGFFPVQSGSVYQPYQPITLGAGSTIVYTEGTEGSPDDRISADVVVISTDLLIDDIGMLASGAAYVQTWDEYTNNLGEYSYGYHLAASPTASNKFTYNLGAALDATQPKELKVSWMGRDSRETAVTYRVTHAGGITDITVNQQEDASGATIPDTAWSGFRSLGAFQFNASSKLEVVPSTSGAGSVSADTIALGSVTQRNIVANFDDGDTSTDVDGFPGRGGEGWAGGWQTYASSSGTTAATVTTANALGDQGDPYLSVVGSGTDSIDHLVRRQYGEFGDVNPASPHRVSWQWRFDGDMADLNSSNDRIHFFGQDNAHTGSGGDNSWLIGWIAADGSYDIHQGKWYFYDRVDGAFSKANMLNTNLDLVVGAVYDFSVVVDPQSGTYDAWMSDGTNSFAAADLTFRNGETGVFDWLHFGGAMSDAADDWAFSLDSITIENVPEPATVGLLILAMPGLLLLGRRTRRGRRAQRATLPS